MTQAPQSPLQHSYLGDDNPEELIPSRFGVMPRWKVLALSTGEIGGLTALRDRVKNDAISALDEIEQRERVVAEREAHCDQRERRVADAAARISGLADRAAAEWDRVQQARADQEREAEPQAKPPGAPDKQPDDTHVPTGDLHTQPAKDPEQHEPLAHPPDQPADPAPGMDTDAPPLHSIRGMQNPDPVALDTEPPPPSVPLSYIHGGDQAEFPDPQSARPPTVSPPIAAGLD